MNLSRGWWIILFLCFLPIRVFAAEPLSIVINEIAWMGTQIEEIESKNWWRYEWLELYNNAETLISLDGWKIELYRTNLDWSIELKGNIKTEAYFLIVASEKIFSNYDFNYLNLSGKLVNAGQKVLLKDAQNHIIDEINCLSGWFAGDNLTKQTMERINPSKQGNDPNNWKVSQNPGGTPKVKNSVFEELKIQEEVASPDKINQTEPKQELIETRPLSINYPAGIVFNEILPSPEGPDTNNEWIEIFNQNNFEVDLSNWRIEDQSGKISTYTFPEETKISPQGFLMLSRPKTKITLNNDGDGLKFIQPNGKIIDSVSYQKAPRGQSYNRIDSKWAWSSSLTPGSVNIIPGSQTSEQKAKEKAEAQSQKVETPETKKGLAAVSEQVPKTSQSLFIFLIALAIAIFSGVIILILKNKLKKSLKSKEENL